MSYNLAPMFDQRYFNRPLATHQKVQMEVWCREHSRPWTYLHRVWAFLTNTICEMGIKP